MVATNIRAIGVRNKSTAAGANLVFSPGSSRACNHQGGTSPTTIIGPGGFMVLNNPSDGYAVTATTADKIRLAASGGNVDYEIFVFYK